MLERGKRSNYGQLDDEFMERMRELDSNAAREAQLEREGVDKLNWYRETHKEDKMMIESLTGEKYRLQNENRSLFVEKDQLQTAHDDLVVERDQLLARVAELEKGIQEGGDLVE